MKIVLKKADVIEKGRAAFLAGELQCQKEDLDVVGAQCRYSGPCVIGVAMTLEQRAFMDALSPEGIMIGDAIRQGIVEIDEDPGFFSILQSAHDVGTKERLAMLLGIE